MRTSVPLISTKEWHWAILWSVAVLSLTCIPYVIAASTAPEGWHFAGILVNPLDGQSYLAKMQQGLMGDWLFHLTFTPEAHDGALIFTFYLALGHAAALTGLPKPVVFQLARLLAAFGLLLMAFRFTARVTPDPFERRLSFVFILTASGLGWLGVLLGAFPIDLWVPEAFVPYSIFTNPHFPLAMLFMLIIFEQLLQSTGAADRRSDMTSPTSGNHNARSQPEKRSSGPGGTVWTGGLAGLTSLALAMISPFGLLTVWAVLATFLVWLFVRDRRLPWEQIWLTLGVVIFSTPVIFYQYWVSTTNPILAGWSVQNVTPAPKLPDFLLGYGLVGLLAGLGAVLILRQRKSGIPAGEMLVFLWAASTILLVYIPFELQRRMITGLHIPLCILAAIGLCRWLARSKVTAKRQRLITIGVVMIGAFGTVLVWIIPLIGTRASPADSTAGLFFIRSEERAAFEWLQQNAETDQVVLASPRLGLFVPGETGLRAFYGHPFETIAARDKEDQVRAYYGGEIGLTGHPNSL
jgi:hypothetical protein